MQDTVQVILDSLSIVQSPLEIIFDDNNSIPLKVALENEKVALTIINIVFPIAVVAISIAGLLINIRSNKNTLRATERQFQANNENNTETLGIMSQHHDETLKKEIDFNKRSVIPICGIGMDISVEKNLIVYNCTIFNKGLGPGIVKKLHYCFKELEITNLYDILKKYEILHPFKPYVKHTKFSRIENFALSSKESKPLFQLSFDQQVKPQISDYIIDFFKLVDVKFNYENIYGDEFTVVDPIIDSDYENPSNLF